MALGTRCHETTYRYDQSPWNATKYPTIGKYTRPAKAVTIANGRQAMPPEFASDSQRVCSGRILVVEDEPSVAQLIVDVLRGEGHQVEAVLESPEGLARLSRTHYDLVVCDLRMPRLDGPAFYEALIRAGSPVQNRLLFVTGDTLAPRTMQFLEKSKLPYLAKPFLVEELKLAVNRRLERSRQVEESERVPGSGTSQSI